ncbi:MAG: PA0069 family radical SAM protein [Bacteroidia bacterium]|nr:PA0069 family radical SAM protein [Bacteroidia bacterium]
MQQLKGRGAQINTDNRFHKHSQEIFWDDAIHDQEILTDSNQTQFTEVHPKTILNKVDRPDVPSEWSMNPYQGCEHGCVYCYARITHEYWGYSAGKDFEQKIMLKMNAPDLLDKKLSGKSWKASPIMLSGNTDCYQPAERKYQITRKLLEVCLKHKHPVGIITKNALVCRDIDLLQELAHHNLVQVHVSITTLNEDLRRLLEPRTSTSKNRFQTVQNLAKNNIPVNVMMAPIIPGLTSDEIFSIAEQASKSGATSLSHTMVRLNGAIALLFEDWIQKTLPLKSTRVLNLIAESQGGKLHNNTFGERMRGKGVLAESINQQVLLAKNKYNLQKKLPKLNTTLFALNRQKQLNLF